MNNVFCLPTKIKGKFNSIITLLFNVSSKSKKHFSFFGNKRAFASQQSWYKSFCQWQRRCERNDMTFHSSTISNPYSIQRNNNVTPTICQQLKRNDKCGHKFMSFSFFFPFYFVSYNVLIFAHDDPFRIQLDGNKIMSTAFLFSVSLPTFRLLFLSSFLFYLLLN